MRRALICCAVGLLPALAACKPPRLAGRSLGQYEVRGELVENACAEGHPVPEQLWFFVELRHEDGEVGYWKVSDAPLMSGTVRPERDFRFVHGAPVVAVPANPQAGVVGCTLEREETVEGALLAAADPDAGAPPPVGDAGAGVVVGGDARFEGSTHVTIRTHSGDCSALLASAGGPFPALPCELSFELRGERLAEPLW